MDWPTMTDSRQLGDMRAVMRALNSCRTSVYKKLHNDPDFPAPIQIGGKVQFFMDEVEAYKESRPRRRYADSST